MRTLVLGGASAVRSSRRIDLRELGFVGHVSEQARAEIEAAERRRALVLQTAHRYVFR